MNKRKAKKILHSFYQTILANYESNRTGCTMFGMGKFENLPIDDLVSRYPHIARMYDPEEEDEEY